MPDVRSRLLAFATLLSLLLSIATVALWVRSYWAEEILGWNTDLAHPGAIDTAFHGVMWSKGDLLFAFSNGYHITDPSLLNEWSKLKSRPRWVWLSRPPRNQRPDYLSDGSFIHISSAARGNGFGFAWTRRWLGPVMIIHLREIDLPLWALAVVTAILPANYALGHAALRRRMRRGLCLACSYNLKGNTSGICPECGTAVHQTAGVTA